MPTTGSIACSCGESFLTAEMWKKHYDATKPSEFKKDHEARAAHALAHVVGVKAVSVRADARPVVRRTLLSPEERLRAIGREISAAYETIQILEAEAAELLKEVSPLPPFKPTWYKAQAEVACLTCGRETRWRLSGVPRCINDIHREEIRGARDTKGVSDNVWAILMDEEVE